MSNSFPNVIFLFHEGMLTNRQQSAILLREECLGKLREAQEQQQSSLQLLRSFSSPARERLGGAGGWQPVVEPLGLLWEGRHLPLPQHSGTQARTSESRNHTDVARSPLPERLIGATLSRWGSGMLSLTQEALREGRTLGSAK